MWRFVALATLAGLGFGVARAWWDVGSFDAARPLEAFAYPASDEPDYWQPPPDRRATAAFDSLRYEFGKLEVGRTMRHAFRVTNAGDFPLVIAQRDSSCVCTTAELDERPIAPGETAEVVLEWNAPADARAGEPYRQWATIDTNDAEQPSVTLVVEGQLAAAVAAESPMLSFGTVAASQTRTLATRVMSYRAADEKSPVKDKDIETLAISATDFDDAATARFFEVRTDMIAAGELGETGASGGVRLSVTLKPGLPAGPFHQTIRLRTNLADVSPVTVSLVGEIGPDVYVSGPGYSRRTCTLNLGRIEPGRGVERQLTLVAFAPPGTIIEPKVIEATPDRLDVSIGPASAAGDDGARRWPLIVRLSPHDDNINNAVGASSKSAAATDETGRVIIEMQRGVDERIEIVVKFAAAAADDDDDAADDATGKPSDE